MSTPQSTEHIAPGQEKKGPWSPEEDERLRQAVGSLSPRPKWAEIANQVEGRSAKQCRERWEQNLSPRLNKNPISRSEGSFIISFVDEQGKKWAEIARQLTDRSDNNIKNWYNGMVQKGKTGRGSQDEPLRSHFSPEHQNYLNNRGRRSLQRTPPVDQRHAHSYHPYAHRPASYPTGQQQHPMPYPGQYPPSYEMDAAHSMHASYMASVDVRYRNAAPLPTPTLPLPIPHQIQQSNERHPIQLPPLLSQVSHAVSTPSVPVQHHQATPSEHHQQQRPEAGDYFTQSSSSWHQRGLTLRTESSHQRRISAVSPMSRGSDDLPMLSGSVSSTPTHGSPLTPALHQSDVYRHREVSHDEHHHHHHGKTELPKTPAVSDVKMSITNLIN